ncbi:retrovirus-related pol polyprotein from transposon TNT 1-94, partial [Trifolium medium]|nr:retrovirus-related pol polyprotein from transposon TNT 1-94 [Trifolium medium]
MESSLPLSNEVASLVSQTKTSHDLWTLLKNTYAKASRNHLKQLKERLRMASKDMTDHVLRGLNDGYRAVIDGVNARDTPITFDDLLEKLLIQELSIVAAQRQTPAPVRPNYNNKPQSGQFHAPSNQRTSNRKPFLGRCQWCNVEGHVLSQCQLFKQQHPDIPPPPRNSPTHTGHAQAYAAGAGPSQNNFLVDSGATHHVT